MKTSLSVVIPIFDIEDEKRRKRFLYLLRSINEAYQKVNSSFECFQIIIVNDKPTEDVQELLKLHLSNPIFNLLDIRVNGENIGQSESRNNGAKYAKGEYLHFIDQDDFIDLNFYSIFLSKSESIDIVQANQISYYENDNTYWHPYKNRLKKRYSKAKKFCELKYFLISNIAVSPGQLIIKRKIFEKVGGFPRLKNRGTDDYGLLFKLSLNSNYSYRYLDEMKFYYRFHNLQNRNALNMQKSLNEFFSSITSSKLSLVHKIIIWIRKRKITTKLFIIPYVILYINRAHKDFYKGKTTT